jgi:hypothetical protein
LRYNSSKLRREALREWISSMAVEREEKADMAVDWSMVVE